MAKTALLIIDMQNDFVWPGAPMETPGAPDIIPTIQAIRAAFTQRKLPIIHTRYIADKSMERLEGQVPWVETLKAPVFACVPGHMRAYEGRGKAKVEALIDELEPASGELVIDKVFYSAFSGTDLNDQLQAMNVRELIVVGIQTELCVDDTARAAVPLGAPPAW